MPTRKKPPRLPRRSPASLTLPDSITFCSCGPSHSFRMVLASGKTMCSLISNVTWYSMFPLVLSDPLPQGGPYAYSFSHFLPTTSSGTAKHLLKELDRG